MSERGLAISIVVLAIYILAANPMITGLAVHEWLGLGLAVAVAVHCIAYLDRVVENARRGAERHASGLFLLVILDIATLAAFVLCLLSGLLISGTILPALGLYIPQGYFFWSPLHAASAKALLVLVIAHVIARWRRIAQFAQRTIQYEKPKTKNR